MAFLFGSTTPQLSLVEQIGNSTLRYRSTRDALVARMTTATFAYAQQQLQSWASSHVENTYAFDFGTNARNISGWEGLSIAERNQVATGVANLFAAQNISPVTRAETAANVTGLAGFPAVSAMLTLTWTVPPAIIVPAVPVAIAAATPLVAATAAATENSNN